MNGKVANIMNNNKPLLNDLTSEHVYHCAKCGLCLDACPVYREMLLESHSPRGKVQLAKHIVEEDIEITKHMNDILFSSCLLCGSCVEACPSGVRQDALFSSLRWRAAERYGLGFTKKLFFQVIANGWLMSTSAWFGKWVRKIFGGPWIESKMKVGNLPISGIPPMNPKPFNDEFPEIVVPEGEVNARVLYFHGCATNYVFGDVGKAVVSVLTRMGVQVEIPKKQSCCGLPIFLSGDRKTALTCIKEIVAMFSRNSVDAVIVDCATCGSALRNEYVHILKELHDLGEEVDDDLVKDAEYLASITKDVSEFIDAHRDWLPEFPPAEYEKVRVTYHDPCHLVKGQGVGAQPRRLLQLLPNIEFVEMAEANRCCGGGGEYQIEYGEMSARITDRKVKNVLETGAGLVATGCPGCNITIGAHLPKDSVTTIHTVQLIQMALDGKRPE